MYIPQLTPMYDTIHDLVLDVGFRAEIHSPLNPQLRVYFTESYMPYVNISVCPQLTDALTLDFAFCVRTHTDGCVGDGTAESLVEALRLANKVAKPYYDDEAVYEQNNTKILKMLSEHETDHKATDLARFYRSLAKTSQRTGLVAEAQGSRNVFVSVQDQIIWVALQEHCGLTGEALFRSGILYDANANGSSTLRKAVFNGLYVLWSRDLISYETYRKAMDCLEQLR